MIAIKDLVNMVCTEAAEGGDRNSCRDYTPLPEVLRWPHEEARQKLPLPRKENQYATIRERNNAYDWFE